VQVTAAEQREVGELALMLDRLDQHLHGAKMAELSGSLS